MPNSSLKSHSPFITQTINSFKAKGLKESTQREYIRWVREYIHFHGGQTHPKNLYEKDVAAFITSIAVDRELCYQSQNKALCALVHLYKYVICRPIGKLDNLLWAKNKKKLPKVFSPDDIKALMKELHDPLRFMVELALFTGLRISECCALRVASIDFERSVIRVFQGKHDKDRETYFPKDLEKDLRLLVEQAKAVYKMDELRAAKSKGQKVSLVISSNIYDQYLFTHNYFSFEQSTKVNTRKPFSRNQIHNQFKQALEKAGLRGKGTFHTLRHTFATSAMHHGVNIRELQILLGHNCCKTTQLYTHVLPSDLAQVKSPLSEMAAQIKSIDYIAAPLLQMQSEQRHAWIAAKH